MNHRYLPTEFASNEDSKKLYVISVVSNPVMYRSRYRLYRQFQEHMKKFDVVHITVEMAFGERRFEVTETGNPHHVQVRGWDELWHKENLINIGLAHLNQVYPNWQYVAWIDGDIEFIDPRWVEGTIHALQHHMIVQPFSNAIDSGPEGEVLVNGADKNVNKTPGVYMSFGHQLHHHGLEEIKRIGPGGAYGGQSSTVAYPHSGYAWAARREAIDGIGALLDIAILGSGDHHMAWAFAGYVEKSIPHGLHPNYVRKLKAFGRRCDEVIKRDIGYVPGTIFHHWHGKKAQRKYAERWSILRQHNFDPDIDIFKDSQGLWRLADGKLGLRDDLRRYFRQRNEDSIDVE